MDEQLTFASLEPVRLESSFEQILGAREIEMEEKTRRHRWAQWLKLARATDRDVAKLWMEIDDCTDCINRRGRAWCDMQALPCTVNPILSFREGMLGMACCGMGYQSEVKDG